jgi:hypothetical protein
MKSIKVGILALVCIVLSFSAVKSWASDPVGIYGIVEKVIFEPEADSPQRIQIWGAFALSDGKPGDEYLPAQRGYLYYALNTGKEDICRKEWADLKALAGTGQGIGFGFRYDTRTRLRQTTDKVERPDIYPVGMGLTKMGNRHHQPTIIAQIKEALQTP